MRNIIPIGKWVQVVKLESPYAYASGEVVENPLYNIRSRMKQTIGTKYKVQFGNGHIVDFIKEDLLVLS